MQLIKDLGTGFRLLNVYSLNRRYPVSVTFIITYRCNFKCRYCNVYNCQEQEMTTQEIFSMIEQLAKLGMRRLGINGGEPLLREDIGEIIRFAKDKGLFVTLFTNGSLVSKNIDKIKGLDVLLMSLDGPGHIHDAQRFPGSFDKVIEAIKIAKDAGLNIWTNTVITQNNLDYIDFILENAKRFKIKTTYQPVLYYPHSSEEERIRGLSPEMIKYNSVIDKLIQEKKRGGPIVHSLSYLNYIKNPDWKQNKRHCWAGRIYCAITPSGNISPCYPIFKDQQWPNGLKLGFAHALNKIGKFSCRGCFCILVENDFFFSLKPEVIYNTLRELR